MAEPTRKEFEEQSVKGENPDIDCIACDDGMDLKFDESCSTCGRSYGEDGLMQDVSKANEAYQRRRRLGA